MRSAIVAILVVFYCASALAATAGGSTPIAVTGEIQGIIKDSLAQISKEQKVKLELIKILSAQQQVVTGVRYTGEISVKTPDGVKKCVFDILDQSWSKYRKSTITCPGKKAYIVEKGRRA